MWDMYLSGTNAEQFVNAMVGLTIHAHRAFAQLFDFDGYETFLDVGGAEAHCCCEVAMQHTHVSCIYFDLPCMEGFAAESVRR